MTIVIPTWILTVLGVSATVVVIGCAIIGLLLILALWDAKWY
ncbi:hypothetical protein UFOVP383_57 [uncultured Caudovirales phage]|jgi:hypothetical protein|uniref:Uncharacterized protein n=1 Tax=uncultured Caudovirales phage TaxID=2100421 RepID=A0A6J7WZE8_9CAUD|nr:hypothetical protein UFOVP383_57 [uncultured Caudovirales phage]